MMLGEVESAIENVLKVLAAAGAVQYPDTEAMREALRHLARMIIEEAVRKAIEP